MKWRREIDYHGYRSYGGDEPSRSQLGAFIAWLAKIAGRRARSNSSTDPLVGEHGFSLLGVNGGQVPKAADCPFPIKAAADHYDRRDWRLLP